MGNLFSWNRFFDNIPKLLPYLPVTLEIVFISVLVGLVLGSVLAVVRIRKFPVLSQLTTVFISFMRCTPMLVQMLISAFAIPLVMQNVFGVDTRRWSPVIYAVVTFTLNQAAFLSEILRSAFLAVPHGQTEAALSAGLTYYQGFVRIVIPQAVRIAIPALSVDVVGVFQSSSVVFMAGVLDMLGMSKSIGSSSGHIFECYLIVALLFVFFSFAIRFFFKFLEKRAERRF